MMLRRRVELKKSVPFLKKGSQFWLEDLTGHVFGIDEQGNKMEYPLRSCLGGYVYLMATEPGLVIIHEKIVEDE